MSEAGQNRMKQLFDEHEVSMEFTSPKIKSGKENKSNETNEDVINSFSEMSSEMFFSKINQLKNNLKSSMIINLKQ